MRCVSQVVKFRPLRGADSKGGADAKGGRPVLRDNYSFDAESKDHAGEEKGAK